MSTEFVGHRPWLCEISPFFGGIGDCRSCRACEAAIGCEAVENRADAVCLTHTATSGFTTAAQPIAASQARQLLQSRSQPRRLSTAPTEPIAASQARQLLQSRSQPRRLDSSYRADRSLAGSRQLLQSRSQPRRLDSSYRAERSHASSTAATRNAFRVCFLGHNDAIVRGVVPFSILSTE
ncbi:hypothetical protein ABH905_003455 [Pseudomonas frederiksbergensis]